MKILLATALLALSAVHSTQSAHAQIATGHNSLLIDKLFVDGCITTTPIPETRL